MTSSFGLLSRPMDTQKFPGKLIYQKAGPDTGWKVRALRAAVKIVQLGLNERGVRPSLEVDGIFGRKTAAAVRLFQTRVQLEPDGIVGPLTWGALFPASAELIVLPPTKISPLRRAIIEVARSQVGVREKGGPNRGPEVDEYIRTVGLNPEDDITDPWCMAFVYWCFHKASEQLGVRNPCPKKAGVIRAWRAVSDRKKLLPADALAQPQLIIPGDIFMVDHGHWRGHTGLVVDVKDENSQILTVEGNTNVRGSREGDGVYDKTRWVRRVNLGFLQIA